MTKAVLLSIRPNGRENGGSATMREILFRGKDSDEAWHEGFYVCHNGKSHAIYTGYAEMDCGVYYPQWFTVDPDTVGQYTGLTDKNGKKIFEGDIVTFGKYIYQVRFECGSFCLYDKSGLIISKIGGINDHCYSLMDLYLECCWEECWAYDIEVIGNIYDNPELMEVSE